MNHPVLERDFLIEFNMRQHDAGSTVLKGVSFTVILDSDIDYFLGLQGKMWHILLDLTSLVFQMTHPLISTKK